MVEYAVDEANGEAAFLRDHSLHNSKSLLGYARGHVAALDNGDWLVSWGRARGMDPGPDESMTQVDPDTHEEKFALQMPNDDGEQAQWAGRGIPLSPVALATGPAALTAELPAGSHTSVFNPGAPRVVVAFSRAAVDFDAGTPSVSIEGATVASVSAHVVGGEPASAYLVTLAPEETGDITFRLVADHSCADGGICTADGAALSAGVAVTIAAAEHPENGTTTTVTYSGSAPTLGPDGGEFEIASGALRFLAPPDYESPTDDGEDNTCQVTIVDGGDPTSMRAVTIRVTNVNEAPRVSGPPTANYEENSTADVAAYSVNDPEDDPITWSPAGADGAKFTITGGVLRFGEPPDFEANRNNLYEVTVVASGGSLTGHAQSDGQGHQRARGAGPDGAT